MADQTRQYASSKLYSDKLSVKIPNAVGEFDKARIRAYTLYEDIYLNNPEAHRVILRGDDDSQQQIYVPSAETIIEAMCRFHAVGPTFELSSADTRAQKLMEDLWDREAFDLKHTSNKRWGCVRGDSCFYLTADKMKKAGERISIHDLDPSNYFPIQDPLSGKITGCYLVDEVPHPNQKDNPGRTAARRQTYLKHKSQLEGGSDYVTYDSAVFETGKWDPRAARTADDIKFLTTLQEPIIMPDPITTIPVYHIPNTGLQNAIFGRSELAGIETLISAINQSMTDEDITLAIAGLGLFTTDAPPPKDAAGNPTGWEFGPARMIERPVDTTLERLSGVSSVTPMLDHINKANEFAQQGKGVPDIAVGKVDVQIAESGISLKLQLGPILAKGAEKEAVRRAKQDQMFYDIIHQWFPAFEDYTPAEDLRCRTIYSDPMPRDDKAIFDAHVAVFNLGVYPAKKFYEAINALSFGFDLEEADFAIALDEKKKITEAGTPTDPLAERMASEFDANGGQPANNGQVVEVST